MCFCRVVELVYAEGKWTPADAVSTRPTAPALMSMDYSTAGYKLNGNSSRTFWNSSRVLSPLSSTMVSTEPGSSGSAHSGAVGAVGAPANGMGDSVLSTSGGVGRHWHWRRLSALTEEVNEKE